MLDLIILKQPEEAVVFLCNLRADIIKSVQKTEKQPLDFQNIIACVNN